MGTPDLWELQIQAGLEPQLVTPALVLSSLPYLLGLGGQGRWEGRVSHPLSGFGAQVFHPHPP